MLPKSTRDSSSSGICRGGSVLMLPACRQLIVSVAALTLLFVDRRDARQRGGRLGFFGLRSRVQSEPQQQCARDDHHFFSLLAAG